MKTLIITSHPSDSGFTHKIAQSFASGSSDAEIIDLYKEDRQDFLRFQSPKDIKSDSQTKMYQEKIKQSDILVFIHPIWSGLPPAIMKNFCDLVFIAGFGFKFKSNGIPEGLLKGKKAYIYMTCDSPSIIYKYVFTAAKRFWSFMFFGILPFCGINIEKVEIFGKMRKSTEETRKKWLDSVLKTAQKNA